MESSTTHNSKQEKELQKELAELRDKVEQTLADYYRKKLSHIVKNISE
jgi:hypothetical protein